MKLTDFTLVILFTLCFSALMGQQMITDVIVLKGDLHYPLNLDISVYQKKLDRAMEKRGFTLIDNQLKRENPDSALYVGELFIYQYFDKRPVVNFILRSEKEIHYSHWEVSGPYLSVKLAIESIVERLFIEVPFKFNLNKSELFSSSRMHYYESSDVNFTPKKKIRTNGIYLSPEIEAMDSIIPGGLKHYLVGCLYLTDLGSQSKVYNFTINFGINEKGKAVYKSIDAEFILSDKQEKRIEGIVDAFPIFRVNKTYEDLFIIVSVGSEGSDIKNSRSQKIGLYIFEFIIGFILGYIFINRIL